jgi:hypothetical protein
MRRSKNTPKMPPRAPVIIFPARERPWEQLFCCSHPAGSEQPLVSYKFSNCPLLVFNSALGALWVRDTPGGTWGLFWKLPKLSHFTSGFRTGGCALILMMPGLGSPRKRPPDGNQAPSWPGGGTLLWELRGGAGGRGGGVGGRGFRFWTSGFRFWMTRVAERMGLQCDAHLEPR